MGPTFFNDSVLARAERGAAGRMAPPAGLFGEFPPGHMGAGFNDEAAAASAASLHTTVSTLLDGPQPAALSLEQGFSAIYKELTDAMGAATDVAGAEQTRLLFLEVMGIKDRIVAHLAAQRAARMGTLQAQAEELYSQCRRALDTLTTLQNSLAGARGQLNAMAAEVARSRGALRDVQASKPPRGSYPTQKELYQWQERVEVAREAAAEVEQRYAAQEAAVAGYERRLLEARAEFGRLQQQEADVRAKIAGGAPISTDPPRPSFEQAFAGRR